MAEPVAIPKRILSSLLASVSAGVVPRMGAPYIAIGRTDEIEALTGDLELCSEGGASMRFIVGRYGSGKSFLLQLIRGYALERGFVTADADLSPERKICGGKGAGTATYRELLRNLSTKASPDGGALAQILARWFSSLQAEVAAGGILPGDSAFEAELSRRIFAVTREMETEIGGFDFAAVLSAYYTAAREGNDEKRSACLRWLLSLIHILIAVFQPRRAMVTASMEVTSDFPTPPLPLAIPITFLIWESAFGDSKRLPLPRLLQSSPQDEQSWVQFSDMDFIILSKLRRCAPFFRPAAGKRAELCRGLPEAYSRFRTDMRAELRTFRSRMAVFYLLYPVLAKESSFFANRRPEIIFAANFADRLCRPNAAGLWSAP